MLLFSIAQVSESTVDEIINKANPASYYAGGDDGRALVTMTITDKQGRERKREFVILRKDKEDGGEQFFSSTLKSQVTFWGRFQENTNAYAGVRYSF